MNFFNPIQIFPFLKLKLQYMPIQRPRQKAEQSAILDWLIQRGIRFCRQLPTLSRAIDGLERMGLKTVLQVHS